MVMGGTIGGWPVASRILRPSSERMNRTKERAVASSFAVDGIVAALRISLLRLTSAGNLRLSTSFFASTAAE